MNAVLDPIDRRIDTHQQLLDQIAERVRTARSLADQLAEERAKAQGRLATGDPKAPLDLDRLRAEILAARRELQAAEDARAAAEAQIVPLKRERQKAERGELVAALLPLLELRGPQAQEITALAQELNKRVRLYTETTAQAARLWAELSGFQARPMAPFVARWLMRTMRPSLAEEYPYAGSTYQEGPLVDEDAERTTELRAAIERVAGDEVRAVLAHEIKFLSSQPGG